MQGLDKVSWSQALPVGARGPERVAGQYAPKENPNVDNSLQARLEAIGTGELSPKVNSTVDYYA